MRASTKIAVRGFDDQNIASTQEIANTIQKLPRKHLQGLKAVSYVNATQFHAMQLPFDHGCKGAYYPEFRSVIIHDLESRDMFEHIIFHEIGHFVFHVVISPEIRKEWVLNTSHKAEHVTPYAKTNPQEDFAECYAVYAANPAQLAKIPKKHQFFKTKVF